MFAARVVDDPSGRLCPPEDLVGVSDIGPLTARVQQIKPVLCESLVQCDQFAVARLQGDTPFSVGSLMQPRVLVCLSGGGQLENAGRDYLFHQGEVLLLPAIIGACSCRPHGPTSVLEISLPQDS